MDSYNQWNGVVSSQTSPLTYKFKSNAYGYSIGSYGSYTNNGMRLGPVIERGPSSTYVQNFTSSSREMYLSSPAYRESWALTVSSSSSSKGSIRDDYKGSLWICPIVCIK